MAQTGMKTQQNQVQKVKEDSSLKGTLIFVMFIGSFILVSWFAIFYLFLIRA
ncbi:cytochrome c oxidase subunit 2A [Salipaludibacillus keqinensis]|jgi:hypothetical protein|uniref:Cytochrome c oxidase subunit 2A n=1 Tax=Salipaludibacillus keqinensis TaxID=2045207 RepID=A0A323TE58_9BACI|nr:cytochrome c oxidase subunit 2A [Salipaludibacillus keqinensis]PYZ92107.1 cytochrome c oxidase subunit 2A [Salipaludibacillus keqinensis]